MTLETGLLKLLLTAHVTASVGWIGAVAAFLAVALAGLVSEDPRMAAAAYLTLEPIGWQVIVPLSLASLLTGVIQSLATSWGLFRHYWVLIKLILTVGSTLVLLVHMQPVAVLADAAAFGHLSEPHLQGMRIQLVADAAAAIVVLLIATVLSVYKPQGLTPYGWRRLQAQRSRFPTRNRAA
jgi:hypothetical protein